MIYNKYTCYAVEPVTAYPEKSIFVKDAKYHRWEIFDMLSRITPTFLSIHVRNKPTISEIEVYDSFYKYRFYREVKLACSTEDYSTT